MRRRTLTRLVAAIAVAVAGAAHQTITHRPITSGGPPPAGEVMVVVTKIVDGDTVHLAGYPHAVRLIGIDAPESTTLRYGHTQCGGHEAGDHLTSLLTGHRVRIELDRQQTDRYGRTLAYLWDGDQLVNLEMVTDGYAKAVAYPPNLAHQAAFVAADRAAAGAGRGLWASCPDGA